MTPPVPPPRLPLHDPDTVRAILADRIATADPAEVVVCPVCLRAAYARDLLLHFDRDHLPQLVADALSPQPVTVVGRDDRGPFWHVAIALSAAVLVAGGGLTLGALTVLQGMAALGVGLLYAVAVLNLASAGWFVARLVLEGHRVVLRPRVWRSRRVALPLTDVEVGPFALGGWNRNCAYLRLVTDDEHVVIKLEQTTVEALAQRWSSASWTTGPRRHLAHVVLGAEGQEELETWIGRRQVLDPAGPLGGTGFDGIGSNVAPRTL
ncbi:MAG: hypothetical protein H6733_16495 [Alphaproteobacteria bacterium]|nr:hypothetical protein [Alphaproteobacteria bacterium]